MRRLATRLAVAMLLVTSVSLTVAVVSQVLILREAAERLPPEVRVRIDALRGERAFFVWVIRGGPQAARPPVDGSAITLSDSISAIDRLQSAQWRGLLYGLALAVSASLGLAWWIARGIARPIAAVGAASSRISAGDLSARVDAPRSRLGIAAEVEALTDGFNQMASTLAHNERERQALVADVAHELRTPITAMTLRLEALRDGLVPFDAAEVERLARQTAHLHRLVEDLRTLSLADAGRLTLRRDVADVARSTREALEAFGPIAEEKGVTLRFEGADASEPLVIVGDSDRLRQALSNLLDNALRATPEGGVIVLRAEREPGSVRLSVQDQGPGFATADLPVIFERFRQGDEGRRDLRGHSGLGLAIVRALVELHGGRVEARNAANGGAVVTLELPDG